MPDSARSNNNNSNPDAEPGSVRSRASANEKAKLNPCAYAGYYCLLFFAYWFGASRFDRDGDGEFDPSDVQSFLADAGLVSHNFRKKKRARTGNDNREMSTGSQWWVPRARRGTNTMPPMQIRDRPSTTSQRPSVTSSSLASGAGAGGGALDHRRHMDRNQDGRVDLRDIIETKVLGECEEDMIMEQIWSGQFLPWFITAECVIVFCFWLVGSFIEADRDGDNWLELQAGMDTIENGAYNLRAFHDDNSKCVDLRWEAWRWFTYQFTHIGLTHVCMNCIMCVLLGVPLEGLHGHLRMFLMFNVGVFGGACNYFVADAHTAVVGCSGGCYALVGLHVADLIMNWSQKKFRIPTAFFLIILIAADALTYWFALGSDNASHTAHVGGAIAGFLIGVTLGRNLEGGWLDAYRFGLGDERVSKCEVCFQVLCLIVGIVLVVLSFVWLGINDEPRNIFEYFRDERGYCWVRQLKNIIKYGNQYICVKCGTQECIDIFKDEPIMYTVLYSECQRVGWYYTG